MKKKRYLMYVSQLYALAILRPLQKAIWDRGDEVAWFFDGAGAEYLREGESLLKSVHQVLRYNPEAVFVPGNWVPDFFPGIKVQVNHGFNAHKFSDQEGHFRIRGFFDLYVTQGEDTTVPFKKLADKYGHFEVVETGWPKMDPLFEKGSNIINSVRPIVMFASTFTPRMSAALPLFDTIARLSGSGRWQWLVNLHPKMDRRTVELYKSIVGEYLLFPDTDDIIPLLRSADVMVSDTSSILSEFMLQQKPVVTFRNQCPGPHLVDISEPDLLEESIEYALSRPSDLLDEIRAYTNKIHPFRDGRSSERVLAATDRLILGGNSHLKRKPLNLWRKLLVRKKLGYYRI